MNKDTITIHFSYFLMRTDTIVSISDKNNRKSYLDCIVLIGRSFNKTNEKVTLQYTYIYI